MKLRTSFFEKTVFYKDLTRFAPLWALYLIAGVLVLLPSMGINSGTSAANILAETLPWLRGPGGRQERTWEPWTRGLQSLHSSLATVLSPGCALPFLFQLSNSL